MSIHLAARAEQFPQRTAIVAVEEQGSYRILGRSSVDMIKTGGYKVSAREIEEVLRTRPAIKECAVVGIPDVPWGEKVSAAPVLHKGATLDIGSLRDWAKERLASYKIPKDALVVEELRKNAMEKVSKPSVKTLMEGKHA